MPSATLQLAMEEPFVPVEATYDPVGAYWDTFEQAQALLGSPKTAPAGRRLRDTLRRLYDDLSPAQRRQVIREGAARERALLREPTPALERDSEWPLQLLALRPHPNRVQYEGWLLARIEQRCGCDREIPAFNLQEAAANARAYGSMRCGDCRTPDEWEQIRRDRDRMSPESAYSNPVCPSCRRLLSGAELGLARKAGNCSECGPGSDPSEFLAEAREVVG